MVSAFLPSAIPVVFADPTDPLLVGEHREHRAPLEHFSPLAQFRYPAGPQTRLQFAVPLIESDSRNRYFVLSGPGDSLGQSGLPEQLIASPGGRAEGKPFQNVAVRHQWRACAQP